MKTVIAIGGNALVTPGGSGDIRDQFAHSRQIARCLADVSEAGWQIILTHGNGPQVGSILRRVELATGEVYPIDLGLAVADTQAGMGYMLAQTLMNELRRRGQERIVTAVVTSVVVDADDPALTDPRKPIGAWMDRQTAFLHRDRDGWKITEDSGRGWRRIVPSPVPRRVVELPVVKSLVDAGHFVLFGGGGGIPVVENENGEFSGVEAVIDKDLTSAIIAAEIGADVLALVTGVPGAYLNYLTPKQELIHSIDRVKLKSLIDEGHFAAGSMLPKMRAAIDFLDRTDLPSARAVICDLQSITAALAGETGTTITR